MGDQKPQALSCDDLLVFEETLMKLRKIDDNIIYTLNATVPANVTRVESTNVLANDCRNLWSELNTLYLHRENAIKNCITLAKNNVNELKQQKEKQETIEVVKRLRKEQTKLRTFEKELGVEEVVRNRSKKVFYERCRNFFSPSVDTIG